MRSSVQYARGASATMMLMLCVLRMRGFHWHLMEAMSSGLPAFLSDIPVQRESAENAAVYFDLKDPHDFVKKLLNTFNDPGKAQRNVKDGALKEPLCWQGKIAISKNLRPCIISK